MQLTRPPWARIRRPGDTRWHVAGTVVAVVALVVGLGAVLLHAVPTTWQPTVVLASLAHYPMWGAYLGVAAGLVVRRWGTALIAVLVSVLVLVIQVPALIAVDPPRDGTPITVMQANLRLGTANPEAIVQLVREHKVDLLATEELTEPERQALIKAGLATLLPYDFAEPSTPDNGNGIGMWSRYPLSQQYFDPQFELKVLTAHVTLPGGFGMTFAAVHLLPPWPDDPGEWSQELPRLGRLLGAAPAGPVVAAGDYNSTTDHEQFRDLFSNGYADGAEQAGAGYLPTYPADRWFGPVIGIDHLLDRNAVATSVDTVDLPGSDHRGLLARVVLDRSATP